MGDKTTFAQVEVDSKLFQIAKCVNSNADLIYNAKDGSICKFGTNSCNLQANFGISTWYCFPERSAKYHD
jgi:hypothetical protein